MSERGDCFGGGRHFYVKAGESGSICANCGMGERRQGERRVKDATIIGRTPPPFSVGLRMEHGIAVRDRRKGERRDG